MDMNVNDIIGIATSHMRLIAPFLLIVCALIFAESISETLVRIVKAARFSLKV